MKKIPFRNTIMTVWVLLAVASCGSDGGGSVAGGGTGGTGISSGTVTGFGSVFVNGVEFSTTTSSVTVNGTAGPDESTDPHRGLKVGMVVKVDGEFDDNGTTGTATRITYKSNFEGPVGSISAGATTRQAVVLGQTVILDVNQTHFENATFDTLAVGNVIEVSGLLDNTGRIRATFVKKKADSYNPGTEIEVEGTIQNLNSGAMTFQINALTVDYSLATELPSGGLANDQFVEVNGTSSDNGVTLTATEVEIEDDTLGVMDTGKVEMEGFVTDKTSPSQFKVGTQEVRTTASTVFEDGTANNIVPGRKVEVEGSLAGGVLTATKVSFH